MKNKTGKNNPNWKGGIRTKRGDGYIEIYKPEHPKCSKHGKTVYLHRLIMEKHIGRYLLPGEVVHHINGNNADNRLENLALLKDQKEHARITERKRDKLGRFN